MLYNCELTYAQLGSVLGAGRLSILDSVGRSSQVYLMYPVTHNTPFYVDAIISEESSSRKSNTHHSVSHHHVNKYLAL